MSHYYMQDILIQSQRLTGTRKPITVIDPSRYDEFFTRLKACSNVDLETRTFIAVCLSGGLRVTEGLSLTLQSLNLETGFGKVKVLKKKKTVQGTHKELKAHDVYRDFKLHPVALDLLKELLNDPFPSRTKTMPIFSFSRWTVFRFIKDMFGPHACPHSMARHSHASWLLHEKNMNTQSVAAVMKMTDRVVQNYSHLNQKKTLDKAYG